jgi:hypothetical protein
MSGEIASDLDARHKANEAIIVAAKAANAAKAAALPSPVGHTGEPAMNTRQMQGSANGVVPDVFLSSRSI